MCRLKDKQFKEGVFRFLATANIVKEMRDLTILQISTRPAGFWTMMVNEGELLERFNVKIDPIDLSEMKEGQVSILRFDGDNGEYSMLMGEAHTVEGPFNQGTYVWIEVNNLKKLEDKLVKGPYVHHCVGIYENILPQIYDACHYIDGLIPDLYDRDEESLAAIIRGE